MATWKIFKRQSQDFRSSCGKVEYVCLSGWLAVSMLVCLSVLSAYLSVCLSVCLSVYMSVCFSVFLPSALKIFSRNRYNYKSSSNDVQKTRTVM